MAFQRVPNTVQVDVLYLLFGQRCENVFHVTFPGGVDAVSLADTRDKFVEWLTGAWITNLGSDISWIGLEVRNLDIEGGSVLAYTPGAPVGGGGGSGCEPGNVSFCVSGRSGEAGRSFRSRTYVVGMPTGVRTGNSVSGGWANALVTALNALISLLADVNALLTVVSRVANGIERLEAIATELLSFTYTDLYIDSQRRRLTGRGT